MRFGFLGLLLCDVLAHPQGCGKQQCEHQSSFHKRCRPSLKVKGPYHKDPKGLAHPASSLAMTAALVHGCSCFRPRYLSAQGFCRQYSPVFLGRRGELSVSGSVRVPCPLADQTTPGESRQEASKPLQTLGGQQVGALALIVICRRRKST